jgi:hypothetical protein
VPILKNDYVAPQAVKCLVTRAAEGDLVATTRFFTTGAGKFPDG